MKKNFKKTIAAVLILSLAMPLYTFPAQAAEERTLKEIDVNVITENSKDATTLSMLYDGKELYIAETDIASVTKYANVTYSKENRVGYVRGIKRVEFSLEDNTVHLTVQGLKGQYAGAVRRNGETYLPLSSTLPWLDAFCHADKGNLVIGNQPFTYYELAEQYNADLQRLTAEDYFGGNAVATGFVILGSKFIDNVVNLWNISDTLKKMIPDGDGNTLYDRELYEEALLDMASEDVLESSGAQDVFDSLEYVKDFNDITKKIGIDLTKTDTSLIAADFMLKYDIDAITQSKVYDFIDAVTAVNVAAETVSSFKPLMESVATFSASLNMTQEYYEALTFLRDENTDNDTLNKAAEEAITKLNKPVTDLLEGYIDFFIDKGIDYFMDGGASIASDLFSLVVEIIYPDEMEAFSEMSKMAVYGDIESSARNLVKMPHEAVSPEEQHKGRLSMLIAILAAKNTAQALESWDKISNPDETLIKERIEIYDEFVTKLLLCEDGREYNLMQPSDDSEGLLGWETEAEENRQEIRKVMEYEEEEEDATETTRPSGNVPESQSPEPSRSALYESVDAIPKDKLDFLMEEMNDYAFDRASYIKYTSGVSWSCQLIELDMVRCSDFEKDFFIGIYRLDDGDLTQYISIDTSSINRNSDWNDISLYVASGKDPEKLKNTYVYASDSAHKLVSMDISSYDDVMTPDNYFGLHGGYTLHRYRYNWDTFNWSCEFR